MHSSSSKKAISVRIYSHEFCEMIFTKERQNLLRDMGYGKIIVKGEERKALTIQESTESSQRNFTEIILDFFKMGYGKTIENGEESEALTIQESAESSQRNLSVIIRPFFKPEDMKQLQLASERLMATGMNTLAESFASRCKLYIYEDEANSGVTDKFLEQQIKIAKKINPKLARFLQIAGKNEPLSLEDKEEVFQILHDPELSTATLNFCDHIVANYRFKDILVSSLKRVMWHHYIPELVKVEAEAMDDDFKKVILKYLNSFDAEKQVVAIKNLPILEKRVQGTVKTYLENMKLQKRKRV